MWCKFPASPAVSWCGRSALDVLYGRGSGAGRELLPFKPLKKTSVAVAEGGSTCRARIETVEDGGSRKADRRVSPRVGMINGGSSQIWDGWLGYGGSA